jgi:hypothetical protein
MSAAIRRALSFATLHDVLVEVEQLRAKGYDRAGKWDLSQVCFHLAEWMRFPIEGYPSTPAPIRLMLWMMRITIGKRILRTILAEGGMRSGGQTMPQSVSQPDADPTRAIALLRTSVERFQKHAGPLHPSPLFGTMSKDEGTKLQLIHCAHHLSFLVPKM